MELTHKSEHCVKKVFHSPLPTLLQLDQANSLQHLYLMVQRVKMLSRSKVDCLLRAILRRGLHSRGRPLESGEEAHRY